MITVRTMPRIISEQLHGQWTAWFEGYPQIAFGGATREDAEERLRVNFLQNRFLEWHRDE